MKKFLRTNRWLGLCEGLSRAEKPSKNTAGRRMSAKAHFTNSITDSGQWRFLKSENTNSLSRKTCALKVIGVQSQSVVV